MNLILAILLVTQDPKPITKSHLTFDFSRAVKRQVIFVPDFIDPNDAPLGRLATRCRILDYGDGDRRILFIFDDRKPKISFQENRGK